MVASTLTVLRVVGCSSAHALCSTLDASTASPLRSSLRPPEREKKKVFFSTVRQGKPAPALGALLYY
jgi:hypothetical protein